MLGVISLASFCVTYCWLSLRVGSLGCWLGSWGVFLAVTFVLAYIAVPLPLALVIVTGMLLAALSLLPRDRKADSKALHSTMSPAWDLTMRMLIATVFVLVLTGAASILGPHLSGLLTLLPIFTTIVAIFTHRTEGAAAARLVMRGVIAGSFAFAVFFLAIATLIEHWGIVAAFVCALLGTLLMQGCSFWFLNKRRASRGCS
jgi:hypothetical protein